MTLAHGADRGRWDLWLWSVSVGILGAAIVLAHTTIEKPFPSLFLDPYGSYSEVSLPTWDEVPVVAHTKQVVPRYPDRLRAIDGQTIPQVGLDVRAAMNARLSELFGQGRTEVDLTFASPQRPSYVVRNYIRTIGPMEVGFFFWLYAGVGLFLLWSAVFVWAMQGTRSGGSAYVISAFGGFLFLVTFFDYHTTGVLAPLFALATILSPIGFLALAYAFPKIPSLLTKGPLPKVVSIGWNTLIVAAVLGWVWVAYAPIMGRDPSWLRAILSLAGPVCAAVLVVSTVVRMAVGPTSVRSDLKAVLVLIALVPALVAAGFLLPNRMRLAHLLMPFGFFLVPFSVGYALVRRNILETPRTIARRMLVFPVLVGACIVTLISWLILGATSSQGSHPGVAIGFALLIGGLVGIGAYRGLLRRLFPAQSSFRPMIIMLADNLAELRKAEEIRTAIAQGVKDWMAAQRAEIVDLDSLSDRVSSKMVEQLKIGQTGFTSGSPRERDLLIPLRTQGEVRGILVLGPKHDGGLYEEEDLALLQTVGTVGATALQHAEDLAREKMLRQLEVESTRGEKKMALGLLAAEMSHEIAYPLNFFRFLLGQARRGTPLAEEDVDIGGEEVERLERMLGTLRRLQVPRPRLAPVRLSQIVERVTTLLRGDLNGRTVEIDVAPHISVMADFDPLLQLLANLLRNALQATPSQGRLGIRTFDDGKAMVCEVWDEGPGIPATFENTIFSPWVSFREGGLGLGLAISNRIARGFGWELAYCRDSGAGKTRFQVRIPTDLLVLSRQEAK